jgi:type IX secretion system PorP/SprF family membrane protein
MRKARIVLLQLFFALCISTYTVHAQQLTQYTQYVNNYFGLNPAAGGSSGCLDIKAGHRRQWVGFENAPVTSFASVNGPIKNKAKPYIKNVHVIGAYFENDRTGVLGPTSRTCFFLNYSYHLALVNNIYASAGFFAGIMQYSFASDRVTVGNVNDNAISAARKVILYPDINPGFMIYGPSFFLGYSMKNAVGNKLDPVYGLNSSLARHHYLTGGLRINGRRKEISFLPSVNVKMVKGAPTSLDVCLLMDYKNVFMIGALYRKTDAAAAIVQFRIKALTVGSSYDYNTSRLRVANANTHEVILGYRLCRNKNGDLEDGIRCWAYQ